ncbi:hypothetical protein RYX36_003622 [Vicia faba]
MMKYYNNIRYVKPRFKHVTQYQSSFYELCSEDICRRIVFESPYISRAKTSRKSERHGSYTGYCLTMAHFTHCLIFVLLLVSCDLLPIIEGRSLRESIGSFESSSFEKVTRSVVLSSMKLGNSRRNLQENVEAFRPTTPGHSPGVGHSVKN